MPAQPSPNAGIVVLGAGVTGLTTATEYLQRHPDSGTNITVVAKYLPGDYSPGEYCSAWAGANWLTFETDGDTPVARYDRIAFPRFEQIVRESPDSGVVKMPMRLVYDGERPGKSDKWYEALLGGIRDVPAEELPQGASWAEDMDTVMINPPVYLMWLVLSFYFYKSVMMTWFKATDEIVKGRSQVRAPVLRSYRRHFCGFPIRINRV